MSDKQKRKKLNPLAIAGAIILLIAVVVYAFFGDRKEYDIIGTWVVDTSEVESGFQCGKHGIAASVKNSTKQYNSWELKKGKLILKGKLFSNGRVNSFCDTLLILNLNAQNLTITQYDSTVHYHKIR